MFPLIFENLDFGQYLKKNILSKNFEHFDQNFENVDFSQNFRKN